MPDAQALDGLQLDELQVVSDLHLGGPAGFQIFASGAELAWLADSLRQSPARGLAALLINGDFIDFLAEPDARAFDPDGGAAKLDRVLAIMRRDLGVDWQATSALHLNLRGFVNTISDAIVTNIVSAVPSQVRSENAGGARSAGFELDSRYALGAGLTAFANFTHTRTRISDNLNPGNDGSQIPFAPDRLANAGLVVPLPGELVVAAYYHWVGRYYDSTDQASRQSFGNYGVINLRAQKVLSRTAGYTALATADLNNLTDRQYRMPFDFRDPGISGFAGVEVRY